MAKKAIDVNAERVILNLLVKPRSSVNEWGGEVDQEEIQLKIASPPVDGAANKACIKFVAKTLGTAKTHVKIVKGEKSRHKRIQIEKYNNQKLAALIKKINAV